MAELALKSDWRAPIFFLVGINQWCTSNPDFEGNEAVDALARSGSNNIYI